MRPARIKRLLWSLALVVLVLAAVQAFWVGIYHVDTGSMEPTILGSSGDGEYVLVVYDDSPPRRFEVVTILRDGEGTPAVKRIVGLPGEEVLIAGGDVLIDGARLPADAERPEWVPIFDSALFPLDAAFSRGSSRMDPWTDAGDHWTLDSTDVVVGAQAGMMFLRRGLHDGYLTPDGDLVVGKERVGDGLVSVDVRFDARGGRFRILLLEQGDAFQVALVQAEQEGFAELSITRRNSSESEEELASTRVAADLSQWQRLTFSNRDNHLVVELGDHGAVLQTSYELNVPHPREGDTRMGRNPLTQAAFGGEGCRVSVRDVRVARDLHYVARGDFGEQKVRLGPNEYYVLGDNSSESLDSRSYGPVTLDEIVGRPVRVVWPPARWRPIQKRAMEK